MIPALSLINCLQYFSCWYEGLQKRMSSFGEGTEGKFITNFWSFLTQFIVYIPLGTAGLKNPQCTTVLKGQPASESGNLWIITNKNPLRFTLMYV